MSLELLFFSSGTYSLIQKDMVVFGSLLLIKPSRCCPRERQKSSHPCSQSSWVLKTSIEKCSFFYGPSQRSAAAAGTQDWRKTRPFIDFSLARCSFIHSRRTASMQKGILLVRTSLLQMSAQQHLCKRNCFLFVPFSGHDLRIKHSIK